MTNDNCCDTGCCNDTGASPKTNAAETRDRVREGYSEIARSGVWSGVAAATPNAGTTCGGGEKDAGAESGGGGCCGPTTLTPGQVAEAVGYSPDDLAALPDGANMGLSCGNPTALASLKPGETVLDLGSGGGFDCFLAGPRVGAAGRVIGVDMTPEMLSKARTNLDAYRKSSSLDNVEFRLGEIEHLPLADNSIDVVISNCVLNLSPEKAGVWREIARVLKPGGRVAVSDLALLQPLPDAICNDLEALVGCIAGAVLVDETERDATNAGLVDITLTQQSDYIDAMTSWDDPLYIKMRESLPEGATLADYVTSLEITARKPD
ncbi:MAG: arsenite methyltransferase [Planctomycetota bacterium]|nr:arsenite methyltransferase [Planctomycetota bacterium]